MITKRQAKNVLNYAKILRVVDPRSQNASLHSATSSVRETNYNYARAWTHTHTHTHSLTHTEPFRS